jgi:hypothetical protein
MGFKCDYCGKEFIHNGACLKKHIADCNIANNTSDFSHLTNNVMINNIRGSYSRHKIKNALDLEASPPISTIKFINRLKCPDCPKLFANFSTLETHQLKKCTKFKESHELQQLQNFNLSICEHNISVVPHSILDNAFSSNTGQLSTKQPFAYSFENETSSFLNSHSNKFTVGTLNINSIEPKFYLILFILQK